MVLGAEAGDSEDQAFWTASLRRLREHWLSGLKLVSSDAHPGIKQAIASSCHGYTSLQRCRVHFAMNPPAKLR